MPVRWARRLEGAPERSGAPCPSGPGRPYPHPPLAEVELWPSRMLTPRGFVTMVALTAVFVALPLLALLGRGALWVELPFALVPVVALFWAVRRNNRDGKLIERLRLWPERIEIDRFEPDGTHRHWHADPYWVRLGLHAQDGPVENYLTLTGAGRSVELGAFLSPEEREKLHRDLVDMLAGLR